MTRSFRRTPAVRPARPRLLATTAVVLAGGLALSGCSVSSTPVSPGTAAEVGTESVGLDEVDDVAAAVCGSLDDSASSSGTSQQPPQSFAGAQVRTTLLEGLVMRSLADQARGRYDVSASSDYAAQEAQAEDFYAGVPHQDSVVSAVTGGAYFTDIVLGIGRTVLGQDDAPDTSGDDPTDDGNDGGADQAAFEAGYPLVRDYLDSAGGLEVNPLFGQLSFSDDPLSTGQLVFFDSSDDSLSVPVSSDAKAGAAQPVTPAFLDTLSSNQVCG